MAKKLERMGTPMVNKNVDIVLLSRLSDQNDADVCMLERSSGSPT